jgi:hypothetical protein
MANGCGRLEVLLLAMLTLRRRSSGGFWRRGLRLGLVGESYRIYVDGGRDGLTDDVTYVKAQMRRFP